MSRDCFTNSVALEHTDGNGTACKSHCTEPQDALAAVGVWVTVGVRSPGHKASEVKETVFSNAILRMLLSDAYFSVCIFN